MNAFILYPAILFLEIYPKERIMHMWKDAYDGKKNGNVYR